MGGDDVFCALCGALAGELTLDDDGEEEFTYDQSRLAENGFAWLANVRIVGENPNSPSADKTFLTGTATYDDSNFYDLDEADEVAIALGSETLRVYDWDTDHPLAIPLHAACYELLGKITAPKPVDLQVLYETFKAHCPEDFPKVLDFDYGEITECHEQYWCTNRGTEYVTASPIDIPHINDLVRSLLQESKLDQDSYATSYAVGSPEGDVFGTLPRELLGKTVAELDLESLCKFRLVSRHVAEATSTNSFWKSRVHLDMPWILEFLEASDLNDGQVDWLKLYKALRAISLGKYSRHIPGLQNRARIWALCSKILEDYMTRLRNYENTPKDTAPILAEVQSTPLSRLILPEEKDTITSMNSIIHDFADLNEAQPIISTYWTNGGELAGIGAKSTETGKPTTLGSSDMFDVSQDVQIPQQDWITGVVVTSQDSDSGDPESPLRKVVGLKFIFAKQDPIQFGQGRGDLRLIKIQPGYFAVGFSATWGSGKSLAKMAILQQPINKAPSESQGRLAATSDVGSFNPKETDYLWANDLPPENVQIVPCEHGYWAYELKVDTAPMEPLIFGTTDEELANITSIAGDVHFGGFEVAYSDGTRRSIGPRRNAMKELAIDGPGGERIICVYASINHIINGFRFVTNRGRQLILGQSDSDEKRFPPRDETDQDGNILAGIYCYWLLRTTPKARLDAIGAFQSSFSTLPEPEITTDSHGFHWSPNPPARPFEGKGKIYGWRSAYNEWTSRDERTPSENATVSLLDCERPLNLIKVALCHGSDTPQVPMLSISFKYSDNGEVVTVGPSQFSPPNDSEGINGHYYCWCDLGRARKEELEAGPHYTHDEWNVGGSQLKTFRLWLNDIQVLTGLQFVAQNGRESPRWGYCEAESPVELDLETVSHPGLKLFMDNNERQATYDDYVVAAVQLVEFEGS
ncbi:hypothetical protein FDECE_12634 [Fusarium decemcellulare]|nr:hypothetical protein FDECE_12634 [Fusarium decemcellulare]